jgi:cysteinyl-tRNA synthetase
MTLPAIQLYNSLTRKKEVFEPLDANNIRMYVCGPTVYDRPHLGNARSVVVYDVLYRLLCHTYGEKHVTYVRNITDVDDKINAAAKANAEPISALTNRVEGWFHADMDALNCLRPNVEPHATAHIAEMVDIIEKLLARGFAYESKGHVLFAVDKYSEYGALSGRKLDELVAGARIAVEDYKRHPGDFVLWKPAEEGDDPSSVFDSPWGAGRPGWHIECSAMSSKYLGDTFDIHGGGADLKFPHHENEIAQSRCSAEHSHFARYWVHNGFLTVNGEKMSKSLGNFTTVKDVLNKKMFEEVIRLALLSAHYSSPLNWNDKLIHDSKMTLLRWNRMLQILSDGEIEELKSLSLNDCHEKEIPELFLNALKNDLNFSVARTLMDKSSNAKDLFLMGQFLGFFGCQPREAIDRLIFDEKYDEELRADVKNAYDKVAGIQTLIDERLAAKAAKNWARADEIRKQLADSGILLEDRPDGTTDWRRA